MGEVEWFFTTVAMVIAVLVAGLFILRSPGRWGLRRARPIEAGTGPYRAGRTAGEEPVPIPGSIRLTSILSVIWGVLTVAIFAPAGSLLLLVFIEIDEPVGALAAVALASIVLSGFALGGTLLVSGYRLVRRSEGVPLLARTASRWSFVHHVAVGVFFTIASIATGDAELVLVAVVIVWSACGIGIWLGSRLDGAHVVSSAPLPAIA